MNPWWPTGEAYSLKVRVCLQSRLHVPVKKTPESSPPPLFAIHPDTIHPVMKVAPTDRRVNKLVFYCSSDSEPRRAASRPGWAPLNWLRHWYRDTGRWAFPTSSMATDKSINWVTDVRICLSIPFPLVNGPPHPSPPFLIYLSFDARQCNQHNQTSHSLELATTRTQNIGPKLFNKLPELIIKWTK